MANRRCILHIGICKTGTTAIQYSLAANRMLLAKAGVVVPRTYGPTHNHRHLTLLAVSESTEAGAREWEALRYRDAGLNSCKSPNEAREWVMRSLANELAGVSAESWVVFSSEQLSQRLLTIEEIIRLRSALEQLGFETVRVVVYLREQIGLSLSWESMELIAGHQTRAPASTFDHRRMMERWENVWGREALVVRTYAKQFLDHGDVVKDFATYALGISGELVVKKAQSIRNERLGRRSIWILRKANHWLPRTLPKPAVQPVRKTLLRISRKKWFGGEPKKKVEPTTLKALETRFKRSNKWVDQRYGTHLDESFGST